MVSDREAVGHGPSPLGLPYKITDQRGGVVLGCPFGNLALEVSTQDKVIRDRIRAVFDGYCSYFEDALREAAAAGNTPDGDLRQRARAMLAYFQGAMLLAKTHNDPSIVHALAEYARALAGGRKDH